MSKDLRIVSLKTEKKFFKSPRISLLYHIMGVKVKVEQKEGRKRKHI